MAKRKRRIVRKRRGGVRRRPRPPHAPPGVKFAITPTIGTEGRVPKAAQPRPTEPVFLNIWMVTQEREFDSAEEFEAFLSRYMMPGELPDFPEPTEPWYKAQELAYEGWAQGSPRKRAQFAHRALAISRDAVDAYLLQAHDATSWEEAVERCTQAVAAAERLLGPDPFTEYEGHFWDAAITRPYMRARFALGYALWRQGRRAEARAHFEELLRLNPGDNQGARYVLVALLLEQGEDEKARRVMDPYSPDTLCHWAYNRVLWQFRRRGDHAQTAQRLMRARSLNPFVPELLLGERRVRSWELELIEPGGESEAIEYVQLYKDAWATTPGALEWLAGVQ